MIDPELQRSLELYADGELTGTARDAVLAHLADAVESRALVERCRALREAANRAHTAIGVPRGLHGRVLTALRRSQRTPLSMYALRGFVMFSAAAVIALSILPYLPKPAQPVVRVVEITGFNEPHFRENPRSISADEFAAVYDKCAHHGHDAFGVRGQTPAAAKSSVGLLGALQVLIPDLAPQGYQIDGACTCLKCGGARSLHVFYRNERETGDVISVFSFDDQISVWGKEDLPECAAPPNGERTINVTTTEDVNIVEWSEGNSSYAIVGRRPLNELCQLAQSPELTQLGGVTRALAMVLVPGY